MPPDTHYVPNAFAADWLDVGHGHRIYYEQAGAAAAIAVVLLHGGPGSGSNPRQRELFDPSRFRVVQFDQRGCGRSTPMGETAHNHTQALIDDIEKLRSHLGIARWLVCGGSWGAALALAYAAQHQQRVSAVLLRSVFLTGKRDIDWFFHGASALAPEAHAQFMQRIPKRWRRSVVTFLDRRLTNSADGLAPQLAAAWQTYEMSLANGRTMPVASAEANPNLLAKYRIQAHYLARRCFLGDRAVLRAASELRGLPVAIVHGTHDWVCPGQGAWRVQRACPGSRLAWAQSAGHDPWNPKMQHLQRSAIENFAKNGNFSDWPVEHGQ
jgi:proline iminopeptidase